MVTINPALNQRITMGEAKRKKQQLGGAYGTPLTSKRAVSALSSKGLSAMDREVLGHIKKAASHGRRIILVGGKEACALAERAGLPWLHELADPSKAPYAVAWNPVIAESGGPMLRPPDIEGAFVVYGAGISKWHDGVTSEPPPEGSESEYIKSLLIEAQMNSWCEVTNGYL